MHGHSDETVRCYRDERLAGKVSVRGIIESDGDSDGR